jgi:hypothetical protein
LGGGVGLHDFGGVASGFHGGVGGYEAHSLGGVPPARGHSHSPRGVSRGNATYGLYGGGGICDQYLVQPLPAYCQFYQ